MPYTMAYSKEDVNRLLDAQENITDLFKQYRKAAKAATAHLSEFQVGILKLLLTESRLLAETYGSVEVHQIINLSEVHPLSGQQQAVVCCYLPEKKINIDIYPDHLRLNVEIHIHGLQGMIHNPTPENRRKLTTYLRKAVEMAAYYREE